MIPQLRIVFLKTLNKTQTFWISANKNILFNEIIDCCSIWLTDNFFFWMPHCISSKGSFHKFLFHSPLSFSQLFLSVVVLYLSLKFSSFDLTTVSFSPFSSKLDYSILFTIHGSLKLEVNISLFIFLNFSYQLR